MTNVLSAQGLAAVDKADAEPFGWMLIMDLRDCNPGTIDSGPALCWYVESLCEKVLHMERHGETLAERFGRSTKTRGYTVAQLLTDSNMGGHFSVHRRTAYLDVFSCKWYDPDKVIAFTLAFFGATLRNQVFLERR